MKRFQVPGGLCLGQRAEREAFPWYRHTGRHLINQLQENSGFRATFVQLTRRM